eukprot:1081108-Karenia_brevis.AAC.1
MLYKLFSRLLRRRLTPILNKSQSVEQAGFRKGFCTEDHLFSLAMLQEKSEEFQRDLWIAALDFRKAFDMVNHESLWKALDTQGTPRGYVSLLQKLYRGQHGTVRTDKTSRMYMIQRGTKQWD